MLDHAGDPREELVWLRRYFRAERRLYAQAIEAVPGLGDTKQAAKFNKRLEMWLQRTRRAYQGAAARGLDVPRAFLRPYATPKSAFLPKGYETSGTLLSMEPAVLRLKYQLRGYNILREYVRIADLAPELLDPARRYEVLELSAGSGAAKEICARFGHSYRAADYMAGRGSAYEPLHQELGLVIEDFDGRSRPFRYADASQDVVLCCQAIDAYGPVHDYAEIIANMARIARRRVVVVFNMKSGAEDIDFEGAVFPQLKARFPNGRVAEAHFPTLPAFVLDVGS